MYHPLQGHTRWFCGSGKCERLECRNLFWSGRVRLISALIEEQGLCRFFTLTLDRSKVVDDAWGYIHHPWSKMRKRMTRRFDDFKFVAILESHKDTNWPHIHGFTNAWMLQRTWSTLWDECGGGPVVWVEQVKDKALGEYVSKTLEVAKYVGKTQLVEGYKKRGKHRSLWRSKGLKAKYELTREEGWRIVKKPIFDEEGRQSPMADAYTGEGIWQSVTSQGRPGENMQGPS